MLAEPAKVIDVRSVERQLLGAMEAHRSEIAQTIDALRALSEAEIFACGDVLSQILLDVRRVIASQSEDLARAKEMSDNITAAFIGDVQNRIREQQTAAADLSGLASEIKSSTDEINHVARISRILALNAKVEAARFGPNGRAFGCIADQMFEFSDEITSSIKRVENATASVQKNLPDFAKGALGLLERTHEFIADMSPNRSIDETSANGESTRLDTIVELSNRALSHLQFQDPLVQKLEGVNHLMHRLQSQAEMIFSGEGHTPIAAPAELPMASTPRSGDVNLF